MSFIKFTLKGVAINNLVQYPVYVFLRGVIMSHELHPIGLHMIILHLKEALRRTLLLRYLLQKNNCSDEILGS